MKARDEARERAVTRKLYELEQKHEFVNARFLKHFAKVSELLEPTVKDGQVKVKPADKMLMIPALFNGEKPKKAKMHYKRFNQYIKFQTKEGNIKDTTKEAIELFEHWLLPHLFYKVQVQFPDYINILHNPKIKTLTISLSCSKVQKVEEERNQVKANRNLNSSLNHLPLPQKKRNIMKRQITIIIMRIIEVITEAANHTGVNNVAAKNLTEVPNKGEGASKTIIGTNTKATTDNSTPPTEAITNIIMTVIIEAEVDMAMVVIVTEVAATGKTIIEAITITNTTSITHMMMVHRWSNMAHHVHFVVASITLLSVVLRESMT